MKIKIQTELHTVKFELNDSQAAKDLYDQLPFNTNIENNSSNEKYFNPPKKLVSSAPQAQARRGSLCYFPSWGEVIIFYKPFGGASGLLELGQAVSGEDEIRLLTGRATISAIES